MIVNRGQRRGVVVRRNIRRAAVVNAARIVGNALYNRVKNYRYKSGQTKSVVERKMLGPQPQKKKLDKTFRRVLQEVGVDQASTGNELTKFSTKVGRYPKLKPTRLLKLMKAGMTDVVLRSQGISNFDTNVGWYPLANRGYTDGIGDVVVPMHVWDLTKFPNISSTAPAGHAFGWDTTSAAASLSRVILPNQFAGGTSTGSTGDYQIERSGGDLQQGSFPHFTKAMHDWSHIKMNLYGARKRGTTYYIDIVRCKDEYANLIEAAVTNPDLKDLVRTLQSKLIYSNLQSHNMKNMSKLQIVKSFQFYVPGGSADDLDTIGKVKEFNLFLRQGNVYSFDWTDSASGVANSIPHGHSDGIDYVNNQEPHNHPWHSSRLYMILRAFSPERREATEATWTGLSATYGAYMAPADPLTEPSYDIVIRNKWTLPT